MLLILVQACRLNKKQQTQDLPLLYQAPLTVKLDTINGYTINPINGDSIVPLVNSKGISIRTGVQLPFKDCKTAPK
ncbi:MAG: hypothetical protein R2765_06530 [Ferruginibacter sp.]